MLVMSTMHITLTVLSKLPYHLISYSVSIRYPSLLKFNVMYVIIPQMRWGSIDCLKDSTRCLRISNRSPIAASLQVFLRLLRSKFELKVESIVLEAGEEYDLEVTANLDDSVVVKEELHIMVAEGEISCLSD